MMRVAELTARHSFRLTARGIEDPQPGFVQVRVTSVGICGSDLHNFADGSVGDTPSVYPMVLGHEPAGVVVKSGVGVTGWSAGDQALLEPAIYCYHCEFCMTGRHNVCSNLRFLSQPEEPGFFRDYVNLPARNLLPLPKGLSMLQATLFEPLAVVLHSMKFVQPRPGETAAVFGAGPIGQMTVAVLKMSGISRVWAIDPVPHRREQALKAGADAAIDPRADDPVKRIMADTGKRGVDVAVDCAALGPSMNQCLHAVRNAGRVVITAIPAEAEPRLQFHAMRRKEVSLYTVRRSNHESALALELLVQHNARFAPTITHTRPLEKVEEAFFILERYEDGVGKIAIDLANSSAP